MYSYLENIAQDTCSPQGTYSQHSSNSLTPLAQDIPHRSNDIPGIHHRLNRPRKTCVGTC